MSFPFVELINGSVTPSQVISAQIASQDSTGPAQREFLQRVISEFNGSPSRQYMDVAQRYYENQNDILKAKRMVIGKDAENNAVLKESKILTNNKLCHNFMKKLTRQKIGYMLGRPFVLTALNVDDTKAEAMFQDLKLYFQQSFFKMLKNVGRDSIVKGIGWLMVYYDETGAFQLRRCAPEEIIPFWRDSDHTELDAIVRQYTIEKYSGGAKTDVKYIEYYTVEGIYYYVFNEDGKMVRDDRYPDQPVPHFALRNEAGDQLVGTNWLKIPFVPFKYDPDEQSLLIRMKSLIDDYDKKTSGLANDIDDHPNSTMVIKNYDGGSKEEFIQNKNEYRTIFVQGDGDADSVETPLDVDQVDKHIQRLREDIYEFGQGVNTANKDIRDTSGVALRFMYADLDMDCVDWGSEVEWSIMLLIWFLQQDIRARTGIDYSDVEYGVVFNTDVIINETEAITNCSISVGTISGKTIAENHPWTRDADKELAAMREEQEGSLDLEAEYGENLNTGLSGQRISVQ